MRGLTPLEVDLLRTVKGAKEVDLPGFDKYEDTLASLKQAGRVVCYGLEDYAIAFTVTKAGAEALDIHEKISLLTI